MDILGTHLGYQRYLMNMVLNGSPEPGALMARMVHLVRESAASMRSG